MTLIYLIPYHKTLRDFCLFSKSECFLFNSNSFLYSVSLNSFKLLSFFFIASSLATRPYIDGIYLNFYSLSIMFIYTMKGGSLDLTGWLLSYHSIIYIFFSSEIARNSIFCLNFCLFEHSIFRKHTFIVFSIFLKLWLFTFHRVQAIEQITKFGILMVKFLNEKLHIFHILMI